MYRVRSRSLITEEIVESEHTLPTKEDADTVVSFFNNIYKHLFQYWAEPVPLSGAADYGLRPSVQPFIQPQPSEDVQPSLDSIHDFYLC